MASLTVDVDDTQIARVQAAVGWRQGLDRSATAQEIRNFISEIIRDTVRTYEATAAGRDAVVKARQAIRSTVSVT